MCKYVAFFTDDQRMDFWKKGFGLGEVLRARMLCISLKLQTCKFC